jgi:hypothetical protein
LQYGQFAEERILLERSSKAATGKVMRLRCRYIVVVQKGLAGMADCVGHRGKATALACTVRPDDSKDLAGSYRPADFAKRYQRAIAYRQVFNPKYFGAFAAQRFP